MAGNNTELDHFIRAALQAGQSRQAITQALLQAGWTQAELRDALDGYAEVDFPLPVPKPRASLSAREAFLYLVLFTLLYFLCFHLGSLLFDLVNAALPDPTQYNRRDWDFAAATRFSTASILISFPLFVWMARYLGRETERAPIQRFSPIRRWLTYLTLFVSATVLIGNLTALVYNLLGGEFTLRFILKVLIVALIAGAVFIYYLRDLRYAEQGPQTTPQQRVLGRYLLIAAAVLATGALAGGFILTGSPLHQRDLRLDQRRVQDLSHIKGAIERYAREHRKLPPTLQALGEDLPGLGLTLEDPHTGQPYVYQPGEGLGYSLCAEFATDTSTYKRRPYGSDGDWLHGVGRTCFERRVSAKDWD